MARFDVTTFGEGGLRLSVPKGERIERASRFDVHIAGAEANVTGALARLGWSCGWVSALPDTPAAHRVANEYRTAGLDLSAVVWRKEGRVSVYYVEYAEPPRPTRVWYDRKDSCCAALAPDAIDWDYLLDTRHVHMSGITLPLSPGCGDIVRQALARGRERGVSTSFDVNYRNLLWSPETARATTLPLLAHVDILFCRQRDAELVFGCRGAAEEALQQLADLTGVDTIVMSCAEDGLIARLAGAIHRVAARNVAIIDRIGAGDGMVAGVIHGWLQGDVVKGLDYGAVLAALAMSQHGDLVITSRDEVEALLAGDAGEIAR